jgi:hypothetical protein
MSRCAQGSFETDILCMTQLLSGRVDHARFLFEDLAAEAAWASRAHGAPFCVALRAALTAFQLDFMQTGDAVLAHTAAVARLDAMILAGRQS